MSKIVCETIYCVYWKKGYCTLNTISIDGLGRCEETILVDIPDETLESTKKQMFKTWQEDETKTRKR